MINIKNFINYPKKTINKNSDSLSINGGNVDFKISKDREDLLYQENAKKNANLKKVKENELKQTENNIKRQAIIKKINVVLYNDNNLNEEESNKYNKKEIFKNKQPILCKDYLNKKENINISYNISKDKKYQYNENKKLLKNKDIIKLIQNKKKLIPETKENTKGISFDSNVSIRNNKDNNYQSNILINKIYNKYNENEEKMQILFNDKMFQYFLDTNYSVNLNKEIKNGINKKSLVYLQIYSNNSLTKQKYNVAISKNNKNILKNFTDLNEFIQNIKNIYNIFICKDFLNIIDFIFEFESEVIINIIYNNKTETKKPILFKLEIKIKGINNYKKKENRKGFKYQSFTISNKMGITNNLENLNNVIVNNIQLRKTKNNLNLSNENKSFYIQLKEKQNFKFQLLKIVDSKISREICCKNAINNNPKSIKAREIAENILNKSSILLHSNKTRKKPQYIFDEIKLEDSLIKINCQKFLDELILYCPNDNNLIKNYTDTRLVPGTG